MKRSERMTLNVAGEQAAIGLLEAGLLALGLNLEADIQTSRAAPLTGLEQAVEAFDLAQTAAERWRVSTKEERRAILEAVLLNRTLNATSLVTTKRKPFDVLAEGPILKQSRGDRI